MTLKFDLDLSRVIGSTHCLTERNIWVRFNENRPKGSGNIEQT